MSKKVLIICYYWPPAGGPGVQRWLKFVTYLPQFGVEPIVYCPDNPNYPIVDASLVNEIPENITILKQPISEPYRFAKVLSKSNTQSISSGVIPKAKKQSVIQRILLYIRGNFFIPDARKAWVKPSVAYLSKYISENNIDTIITTGPPHSLHLIGLALKAKCKVTWFADFRDPWTTIGYHKALKLSKSSRDKHLALEAEVLNTADHIVVTSKNTKMEFEAKTSKPISVITNGYDVQPINTPKKDHKFTLSHIGSLLSDRNPKALWSAICELILENNSFANAFQLNLIGVVSHEILNTIDEYGLSKYVNTVGYVSHEDAIKAQRQSQVLLLVEIDSEATKVIIPGKLFEYLVSKTPIIAIGPKDSDVENIIASTNTGRYFYYNQKEAIKSQILSYFEAYKNNTLQVNAVGLEQYSRKSLTASLSKLVLDA